MMEKMGWVHTFEYRTTQGFSLDLAQPESMLAVEVNGPSHYLQDALSGKYVVNGATKFKSRLLRSFGWTVIHISHLDWNNKSTLERRQLIAAKLADVALPVAKTLVVEDEPVADSIAETEATALEARPSRAEEGGRSSRSPESEPALATTGIAVESNVNDKEPVGSEDTSSLDGSGWTTTRASRRHQRRMAKAVGRTSFP